MNDDGDDDVDGDGDNEDDGDNGDGDNGDGDNGDGDNGDNDDVNREDDDDDNDISRLDVNMPGGNELADEEREAVCEARLREGVISWELKQIEVVEKEAAGVVAGVGVTTSVPTNVVVIKKAASTGPPDTTSS